MPLSSRLYGPLLLPVLLLLPPGWQAAHADVARPALMEGFPPSERMRVTRANAFQPPYLRWAASHVRELVPSRDIRRSNAPLALSRTQTPPDFDELAFKVGDERMRLTDYLVGSATDGFIVLHKGVVLYERYLGGFAARQPHIWASMSKSVTGLLAAQLIAEGQLAPDARLARYVPELANTPFGEATLQQNLDMEVAVSYPANIPPDVGLFAAVGLLPRQETMPASIYDFLGVASGSPELAGQPLWYYQNGSPEAVAWAISRVTGQSWSQLVAERIWSRFALDDAYSLIDPQGTDMASGGLNSSLGDAARFAETVRRALASPQADDSFVQAVQRSLRNADNRELVARANPERAAYAYRNYWYQRADGDGSVEAIGRFGQRIYINPEREIVIVKLASGADMRPRATHAAQGAQAPKQPPLESQAAFDNLVAAVLQATPR
ncbi:serine hydrolase domain-containing protein [Pseudomonas sp. Q1-7]|uniref:serine hydrolase domain-containing protein n=1 Tax=Pseudomonas sp. Q1-7 TaxID=3020843 RepID=UPI0023011333|nr:serine hydrolase [Pseudomonas sp. Q1-7]